MCMNVPIENSELLEKLDLYNISPAQGLKQTILDVLAKTKVLSPVSMQGTLNINSGIEVSTRNTRINIINIKDVKGTIYLPVFTDWNQINKWNISTVRAMTFTLVDYVK